MKKMKPGSMLSFLPVLLSIVVAGFLFIMFLSWSNDFDTKNKIDQVARKHILKMETVGYLDSDGEKSLTEELKKLGITEMKFDGTTKNKVEYGCQIILSISGNVCYSNFSMDNLLALQESSKSTSFHIQKHSTAKN